MISIVTLLTKGQLNNWIETIMSILTPEVSEVVIVCDFEPDITLPVPIKIVSYSFPPNAFGQELVNAYSKGLEAGVKAASGSYILNLDDDIQPLNRDCIARLTETLTKNGAEAAVGVYPPRGYASQPPSWPPLICQVNVLDQGKRGTYLWWSVLPKEDFEVYAGWTGFMLARKSVLMDAFPLVRPLDLEFHLMLGEHFRVRGWNFYANGNVRADHNKANA